MAGGFESFGIFDENGMFFVKSGISVDYPEISGRFIAVPPIFIGKNKNYGPSSAADRGRKAEITENAPAEPRERVK